MASRSLSDLAPPVRDAAERFLKACEKAGFEVLIYCTLRSEKEQAALFKSGREVLGPILTSARPGQSLHNPDANGQAWAFDAVPMLAGKCLWGDDVALAEMGRIGEACGLTWAGRWRGKLRERVHFEIKRGYKHELV